MHDEDMKRIDTTIFVPVGIFSGWSKASAPDYGRHASHRDSPCGACELDAGGAVYCRNLRTPNDN